MNAQTMCVSLLALATMPVAAWAQPQPELLNAVQIYKLDFVLTTRDGNQPATQRRYSLLIESGAQGRLRTGSRVPYNPSPGQTQYMETGLNLTCRVREKDEKLSAEMDLQLNDATSATPPNTQPVFNNETTGTTVSLAPGQTTRVFQWDSGAGPTARRYELDVTATRLAR